MERKTRDKTAKQNNKRHSTAQVSMLSCDAAAAISLEQTNEQRGVCATLRLGPQTEAAKMRAVQKLWYTWLRLHTRGTQQTHTHTYTGTLWGKLASSKTALRREELANVLRCWPKSHKSRIPCDKTCHMLPLPLATGISMSPRKSRKKKLKLKLKPKLAANYVNC